MLIKGSKNDDKPKKDDKKERVVGCDGNIHDITPSFQTNDLVDINETHEDVVEVFSIPFTSGSLLPT